MGATAVDDLLANFGDPGRHQLLVLTMLVFVMCTLSLNNLMTIFTMGSYPHHCKLPDGLSKNDSLPITASGEYDSCSMYVNASDHRSGHMPCNNGWEYYPPDGEWSITQEWDLVCDKHYQAALATSVYFAGVTIGCTVFGYLADMIGRKPIIVSCCYLHLALSITIAFSTSYPMYAVLRFLDGLFIQGAVGSAYVMSVELFQPHRRNLVAIISQTQWPIMLFLLSALFYIVKNWRTLQLIISLPFAITLVYYWFLPESTRWLIAMRRSSRAKTELRRTIKFNKIPLPPNLDDEITSVIEKNLKNRDTFQEQFGFTDFCRTRPMRLISGVSCYYFFWAVFAFYAIAYSMAGIGSDIYLSYCITSLLDLSVILGMYFVMNRIGRKTLIMSSTALCTGICLLVVVLLVTLPENDSASQICINAVAALGRACLAAYFCVMPIYVNEMSPTVLRNLLSGVANCMGRIGGIVAPQVMLLVKMTLNDFLVKFGDPGRYQVLMMILLWYSMCSIAFNNLMNLFIIGNYPHRCKIPEGFLPEESIPVTETGEFDTCTMFGNASNHEQGITTCIYGYDYFSTNGKWSIVQEWDLVCDKHYVAALATTIYFAGVTTGSLLFGYLADWVGRRPVIIWSIWIQTVLSFGTTFSSNFIMFVIFRFFSGFILQGSYGASYVLSVEIFQPRHRSFIAVANQCVWPAMLLVLAVLCYFIDDWKYIHLVCNVPFIITVVYTWIIPESPRWLIATGQAEKARVELERIRRFNKIPLMEDMGAKIQELIDEQDRSKKRVQNTYGFRDLFRRKKMNIVTCTSCYFYFMSIFAFYAISFSISSGNNKYLSYTISSSVEILVLLVMYFIMRKVGRRTISWVAMTVCAIVCTLVVILQSTLSGNDVTAQESISVVATVGRSSLTAFFSVMSIYISEMSPTVIRNLLMGLVNFTGRIGGMLAPQTMLLETYIWKSFTFLLCGVLALIGAIACVLLPETLNQPLPEVPRDVDKLWPEYYRARRSSSMSSYSSVKRRRSSSIKEEIATKILLIPAKNVPLTIVETEEIKV